MGNYTDQECVGTFSGYFGGKSYSGEWIISHFPEHNCFVDVFCGMNNILFRKKPSRIEIVNDKNSILINIFRQLRNNSEEFIRKIDSFPYSREEFEYYCNDNYKEFYKLNDLDKAVVGYFIYSASFNGRGFLGSGFSAAKTKNPAKKWYNKKEKLEEFRKRLSQVVIENLDYEDVINQYDSKDTLFYMDPPYFLGKERKVGGKHYNIDMFSEEEHYNFLNYIKGINGKIILSGYDSYLYNQELKAWRNERKDYAKRSGANKIATEILWFNY